MSKKFVALFMALAAQSSFASWDTFCDSTTLSVTPHSGTCFAKFYNDATYNFTADAQLFSYEGSKAFLNPNNDTRQNLVLLLKDRNLIRPTTNKTSPAADPDSTLAIGDASISQSNAKGTSEFIAALQTEASMSEREKSELQAARLALRDAKNITSPLGKQFQAYLSAARTFYGSDFTKALAAFYALRTSQSAWIKEAALYMEGRCLVNAAQSNAFDEGIFALEKVDKKANKEARVRFQLYLTTYPEGRYAASARGLLRRVSVLEGDKKGLIGEYSWQLRHPTSAQSYADLDQIVNEIDTMTNAFEDVKETQDPILLSVFDMAKMRAPANAEAKNKLTIEQLIKQKKVFESEPDLFNYLNASFAFYVQHNATDALKILDELSKSKTLSLSSPQPNSNLAVSVATLRALALEELKKSNEARVIWKQILAKTNDQSQRDVGQLGLAINLEQRGEIDQIFNAENAIANPLIRALVLQNTASASILRQQLKDKKLHQDLGRLAIFTLLQKDIIYGFYDDFVADFKAHKSKLGEPVYDEKGRFRTAELSTTPFSDSPAVFHWPGKVDAEDYECPNLINLASRLSKNPDAASNLICLGEFIRETDWDRVLQTAASPPSDAIGGALPQFTGSAFKRDAAYQHIFNDKTATHNEKAYALYRLINCYAPTGSNSCSNTHEALKTRRAWFAQLKKNYADTSWGKNLKIYW